MERIPCEFANTVACPVFVKIGKCFEDKHHTFYPAYEYTTPTEKRFRQLGENIVRMCRNSHNIEHATKPIPEKPSINVMQQAIKSAGEAQRNGEAVQQS